MLSIACILAIATVFLLSLFLWIFGEFPLNLQIGTFLFIKCLFALILCTQFIVSMCEIASCQMLKQRGVVQLSLKLAGATANLIACAVFLRLLKKVNNKTITGSMQADDDNKVIATFSSFIC